MCLRNDHKPTQMTDFSTLLYALRSEIPYLSMYLKPEKGTSFVRSLPLQAIKGSIPQGHIQGHYCWVLHATETGLSCVLVLLHLKIKSYERTCLT